MKNKTILLAAIAVSITAVNCFAQKKNNLKVKPEILQLINNNLKDADAQYKYLYAHVPADSIPRSFNKAGKYQYTGAS